MKFHCDRCKTKYSISDDRVRGKILKIRCKNCSAVITVREEGAAAAKPSGAGKSKSAGGEAQRAGQQALAGAFKQSVTEPAVDPGRSGSSAPPVSLEAEWYVSIDGEQEGPFSLQEARAWVQTKAADDELHCWSEGYDDWLSTDKVSHFRSLRRAPSKPSPTSPVAATPGDDEVPTLADDDVLDYAGEEETPKPLFAATMAAVERRTPGAAADDDIIPPNEFSSHLSSKQSGPFDSIPAAQTSAGMGREATEPSAGAGAPPIPMAASPSPSAPASAAGLTPVSGDDGPNLDFDIGEASRVVDLPALMASRANAPVRPAGAIHEPAGLPGMGGAAALGRGSGQESAIAQASVAPGGHITGPVPSLGNATPMSGAAALDPVAGATPQGRKKRAGLHIPLIVTGLVIAGVAVAMIIMLTGDDEGGHVARGTVGGSGNLGYSFSGDQRKAKKAGEGAIDVDPEDLSGKEPKNNTKVRKGNGSRTNNTTTNNTKASGTLDPRPTRDPDEVDLGAGTDTGPTGPLDGDDLMKVYRKNSIAIKMCYERELKKNPLLKVPKTWVDIKVGLDGRVTGVTIPSLQGTPLGKCMRSRIARWKFRKTTETFSSRFPVVFGS